MPLSPTSVARLSQVAPQLAALIVRLAAQLEAEGVPIQVTAGLRSWSGQDSLYAQGRTKPGPVVTDVPGGYSWHNYGLAVDVVPEDITPGQPDWDITRPAWKMLVAAAKELGLASGSEWQTFPDWPHLQPASLPVTPTDEDRLTFKDAGMAALWAQYFPPAE
jgi:peptidoglycan L-alanyl-D-glutamate endopeptidase CwlK